MELGPVDRITADALGEPGMRTFYLQARAGDELVTVVVEKEQVELLSRSVLELLAEVPLETGPPDPTRRSRSKNPSIPCSTRGACRSATTRTVTGSCWRSPSSSPRTRTRKRTRSGSSTTRC